MRLSCPCCAAEMSLDVLLTHEQARRAVARLAQVSLPFGAQTLQYMALFKPASRALSIERMVRLIDELLPDIERRAITRNGREWAAPLDAWRAALQTVLAMRDKGTLRLPLTDHALLLQVLQNLADTAERRGEAAAESARRQRTVDGPRDAGARDLSALAADLAAGQAEPAAAAPAAPAPAAPRPDYSRPSRAALETRARIEAARAARMQGTPGAEAPSTTPESPQP